MKEITAYQSTDEKFVWTYDESLIEFLQNPDVKELFHLLNG